MNNFPKVSVLIVGFNSLRYLAQCLGSVGAATSKFSYEVIFINNGSDSSEEFVKRNFSSVQVLETRGNIGFAAANNRLAECARGDWLLLLNPDTRLEAGAVDRLLDAAESNPQFSVLGGVAIEKGGGVQARAEVSLPSLRTIMLGLIGRGSKAAAARGDVPVVNVDAVSGGFMMVERGCWTELEGFDESFFLYSEELDFFKRLKERGRLVGQVSESKVFHDVGSGSANSPLRVRYRVTGNAHYFHKHFARPYALICVFFMWVNICARYIGGRLLSGKGEHYRSIANGFAGVAKTPLSWVWGYHSEGADPRKQTGRLAKSSHNEGGF